MSHRADAARGLFSAESVSARVVDGVVHIYDAELPQTSWVPPLADLSRFAPCEVSHNHTFVVHVRSQRPVARLLKALGEVSRLNAARTAYKVVIPDPHPCLSKGYLMVERDLASIRPFAPEDVWAKTPHATTLLLHGPNSEAEIFDWWPALREAHPNIFRRGKTWILQSPLRKRSAPERTGSRAGWRLIAAGHCFACGHAGHTETRCPNHASRCRICGSQAHTAEVCACQQKKLSHSLASKKVATVRKALNALKDSNGVIPPALCRLLEEVSSVAASVLGSRKTTLHRKLHITRPGQQQQQPASDIHPPAAPVSPARAAAAATAADGASSPLAPRRSNGASSAATTPSVRTPSKRLRSPRTPVEGPDTPSSHWAQSSITRYGFTGESPLSAKETRKASTEAPNDESDEQAKQSSPKVKSPPHKRAKSGSGAKDKAKNKRT